jgi:hypothetical protein
LDRFHSRLAALENPQVKLQDTVGIKPQFWESQKRLNAQFQGRNVSHSLCRWHLIKERELSASSVNIAVNAVRFLYGRYP